jgi:uncharacterized damage-inducible protein DinB
MKMPQLTSDPLEVLLAHDTWATRRILECCRPLTREQFHQKFEIGLGSLHETLTHIISATRRWTDRLAGRTPRPFLHVMPGMPQVSGDAKDRSVDELLALHEEAAHDLAEQARASGRRGLDQVISLEFARPGEAKKRYQFSHGAAIVHVCTHALHHRAQCLNMLRHLNVPGVSDKLPDIDVIGWQTAVEAPAVVV